MMFLRLLLVAGFLSISLPAIAQNKSQNFNNSNLPIPRFVSLRSDKVFVRTGPALRYPIQWVFQKKGLPVEVVQEFDTWRKIRDIEGAEGWIHQSLLSGRRGVIIQANVPADLRRAESTDSKLLAKIEPNVVGELLRCPEKWCLISVSGYKGWIERSLLWGVYDGESLP